jgi:hypothetical protein
MESFVVPASANAVDLAIEVRDHLSELERLQVGVPACMDSELASWYLHQLRRGEVDSVLLVEMHACAKRLHAGLGRLQQELDVTDTQRALDAGYEIVCLRGALVALGSEAQMMMDEGWTRFQGQLAA